MTDDLIAKMHTLDINAVQEWVRIDLESIRYAIITNPDKVDVTLVEFPIEAHDKESIRFAIHYLKRENVQHLLVPSAIQTRIYLEYYIDCLQTCYDSLY